MPILECDPEQQADGSTTVHSILSERLNQPAKVGIRGEISENGLERCGIYADVEVTE